jgi:hypothetical protein
MYCWTLVEADAELERTIRTGISPETSNPLLVTEVESQSSRNRTMFPVSLKLANESAHTLLNVSRSAMESLEPPF